MTKVKICGLTRLEDIDAVNIARPEFAGFVFAKSRRQVTEGTAAMLRLKLDNMIKAVGVFVNEDIEVIARLARHGIIDLVQLHGDEDESYIKSLRGYCSLPVIKAVRVGRALPSLPREADYLLFDTLGTVRGGTGQVFNWKLLEGYQGLPYFLAGGLSAWNIARAINQLTPFGVDISSGVETDGVKDPAKIRKVVSIVKER